MAGSMDRLRQRGSRNPDATPRGSAARSNRAANFRDTEVRALERELEAIPTGTGRSAAARAAVQQRLDFAIAARDKQRADANSKRRREN